MKMKKFLALSTASVMALSMVACGNTDNGAAESSASTTPEPQKLLRKQEPQRQR